MKNHHLPIEHVLAKSRTVFRNGHRFVKEGYKKEEHHGCYRKLKFKSLSAVENHILKHFPEDFNMVPYKCHICNRYHMGHNKKGTPS
jgi:hypothetical protein